MLPACLVCTSEAVVGIVAGSIIAGVIDWLTLGIGLDGGLLPLSMLADEAIDGLQLCPTDYAPLKLASPAGNNVVCSLALVVISNIDRALSTVNIGSPILENEETCMVRCGISYSPGMECKPGGQPPAVSEQCVLQQYDNGYANMTACIIKVILGLLMLWFAPDHSTSGIFKRASADVSPGGAR